MLRFLPRSNAPSPLSISGSRPSHLPSTKQWQSHLPWQGQHDFNILAIETSCDDTCVAVLNLEATKHELRAAKLLFNERKTSNNLQYGGIHPLRAMESHHTHLARMVQRALHHLSRKGEQKVDLIAVTKGPGMRNNLQSGIDVAKGLSLGLRVPMMGVHHMHAHALTARMQLALTVSGAASPHNHNEHSAFDTLKRNLSYPMLSLLVSGGHTLLVHSVDLVEHRITASTADIAVGDCLDKVARLVLPRDVLASARSVSYGELLEFFAFDQKWEPNFTSFPSRFHYRYDAPRTAHKVDLKWTSENQYGWHVPIPFRKQPSSKDAGQSLTFSFSGIVSQVERIVKYGGSHSTPRTSPMPVEEARVLGRVAMEAAFEHLADRVCRSLRSVEGSQEADQGAVGSGVRILDNDKDAPKSSGAIPINQSSTNRVRKLVIGGGVAANKFLSHVLKHYAEAQGINLQIFKTPTMFCTDNAAMIAWAAAEMVGITTAPEGFQLSATEFSHNLSMRPLRKWSLENLMTPEKEEERERLEELERDRRQLARADKGANMGDGTVENGEDLAAGQVGASDTTAGPTSTESLDWTHAISASDSLRTTTWDPHSTFGDVHDSILENVPRTPESKVSTVEAPLTKRARVAKRARERAAALEAAAIKIREARKPERCVAPTPNLSSSSQLAEMLARMQDSSAPLVGDAVEDNVHDFAPADDVGNVDLQSTEVTDPLPDSALTDNISDEEIALIIQYSRAYTAG